MVQANAVLAQHLLIKLAYKGTQQFSNGIVEVLQNTTCIARLRPIKDKAAAERRTISGDGLACTVMLFGMHCCARAEVCQSLLSYYSEETALLARWPAHYRPGQSMVLIWQAVMAGAVSMQRSHTCLS